MSKPNKQIREIIEEIYEAGEYHKRAKSNQQYKDKDIDQATQQIKEAIRGVVPEKIPIPDFPVGPYAGGKVDGRNQAIDEINKGIDEL